jgi:hypothetical protein
MRTYNLFYRKGLAELVCAVPADLPVPAFISGATWVFGGKLEDADGDPLAFNREAADASVRYNGFYLFQLTTALEVSYPIEQDRAKAAEFEVPAPQKTLRQYTPPASDFPLPAPARADDRCLGGVRIPVGLSCGL